VLVCVSLPSLHSSLPPSLPPFLVSTLLFFLYLCPSPYLCPSSKDFWFSLLPPSPPPSLLPPHRFPLPARPLNRVCDHYKLSVKAGETVALCGPSGSWRKKARSLIPYLPPSFPPSLPPYRFPLPRPSAQPCLRPLQTQRPGWRDRRSLRA